MRNHVGLTSSPIDLFRDDLFKSAWPAIHHILYFLLDFLLHHLSSHLKAADCCSNSVAEFVLDVRSLSKHSLHT